MLSLGEQIEWIGRGISTNDFVWISNGRIATELKSTTDNTRTIISRISSARSKALKHTPHVHKTNFVIDLGTAPIPPGMLSELADYNAQHDRHPIDNIWLMTNGQLVQVTLK